MEKKFTIRLTENQAKELITLLNQKNTEDPDFTMKENGRIISTVQEGWESYNATLQEHIDSFLLKEFENQ